jgi:hypothetical protein
MCADWLRASNFVAWKKTQYQEVDWALDKDLLVVGNKVYSPETCIYVPQWLNNFTTFRFASRGEYSIGVHLNKRLDKYQSTCQNPISNNQLLREINFEII